MCVCARASGSYKLYFFWDFFIIARARTFCAKRVCRIKKKKKNATNSIRYTTAASVYYRRYTVILFIFLAKNNDNNSFNHAAPCIRTSMSLKLYLTLYRWYTEIHLIRYLRLSTWRVLFWVFRRGFFFLPIRGIPFVISTFPLVLLYRRSFSFPPPPHYRNTTVKWNPRYSMKNHR